MHQIQHNRRIRPVFQGAVGALDGTLILAVVPPDQQVPYRGRGKGECYQNVLAICDFDLLFTFVWAGWEGVAHDSRVLRETMSDLANNFSFLPLVPNRDRLDSFLLERTCSACAEMSNPAGDCKGSPRTFGEPWPQFNDGLIYRDTVKASDSGLTLIDFYSSKHLNSAPLQGWLQRIRNGQIRIDGSVVTDPSTALRAGSELNYHRLPWKEPDTPYLLQVLFEDDDLIALNKPSGLQVLPGGLFQQRTVLTQLQGQASKHSPSLARQEPHPVPVHRLGRGTSGILLCAKTKVAKTRLSAYFADGTLVVRDNSDSSAVISTRKIGKIYRAMVSGILDEDEVVIKQPIGLVRYPGVANGLYVACPSGKPALSKVKVLERNVQGNYMLVEVEIQSGRPHQIRIHLSFIGHPLIGDPLYVAGGQPNCFDPEFENESFAHDGGYQRPGKPVPGDCGHLLHAHKVVLPHPTRSEVIKITAPLPSVLRTQQEVEEIELGAGDEAD